MQGTVLDGTNNVFTVDCADGAKLCSIKGKVLKTDARFYNPLAPGDIVEVEEDALDKGKGQILNLVARKNAFIRWNVKKRAPQLLAANIDAIILVTTPDEPPFRPRFIDRALAQAERQNLTPLILCNKCDVPAFADVDFQARLKIWEDIGYQTLCVSAKTGERLADFADFINGKTVALVGQSGVGKSSLVNALAGNEKLRTGELSQKYERGSHTTTKGTLNTLTINKSLTERKLAAQCAASEFRTLRETRDKNDACDATVAIIDTPGIRRFVLHDIEAAELALYFREFEPLVGACAFGMSCTHTTEAGCKILEAVHAGAITEERYESFRRIKTEIETQSWED